MAEISDLKQIIILGYLNDTMLQKLAPAIDMLNFDKDEAIFNERDVATRFYMLKAGNVILQQRISGHMAVTVSSIKPGYSFGWSAVMGGQPYTTDAICTEPSQVFSIRSGKLKAMMDEDQNMGYLLFQRIVRVMKKRLDRRTEQFVRLIRSHPDIKELE